MSNQPYPGLRPFERDDTDVFFGRDQQIDELLEKLQNHHFIAVTGSSGCGKSSLVKAGMLSGLESGFMAQAGAKWTISVMRPGSDPFYAMAESLLADEVFHTAWMNDLELEDDASKISFLQAELKRGPKSLHEILQTIALPEGCKLLLVVDQFEEIFRYEQAETDAAAAFISLILDSIKNPNIYIVITMRSDFIGDAARFQNLPEAINDSLYLTPRLTREQLKETIELPAMVYGGQVDPLLVNHLLNEIGTDHDHLPLLEHAMMYQWSHDSDHILSLPEYQQYDGGLKNILNLHLEKVYAKLTGQQKSIAETLFRALAERTGDNKYIRRPVKVEEIAGLANVTPEAVIDIVEFFRKEGRNFLMPPLGVELDADSLLDISHESLIRQWRRLKTWVQDEYKRSEIYRRLESAAKRYDDGRGELFRGKDLDIALECTGHASFNRLWANLNGKYYSQVMHFVDVSHKERVRRKSEAKHRKRIKYFSVASVMLGVIVFAAIGWSLKGKAEHAIADMQKSAVTATSILSHAEQYQRADKFISPLVNNNLSKTPSIKRSMQILKRVIDMKGGHPKTLLWDDKFTTRSMDISSDGKWLVAGGVGGKIAFYDLEKGELLGGDESFKAHKNTIMGVRFLSDSQSGLQRFATIDNGSSVERDGKKKKVSQLKIWEFSNKDSSPNLLYKLEIQGRAKALDVSDNNIIAVGGTDRRIELFFPDESSEYAYNSHWSIKSKHRESVSESGLLFIPETNQLISASYDGGIHINTIPSMVRECSDAYSFDRKGMLIVSLKNEKSFRVSGKTLGLTLLKKADLSKPSLLAVSAGKKIVFWDINTESRKTGSDIEGHKDLIFNLKSFVNKDGRSVLASSSIDKTIRLWDAETGASLRVLEGHDAAVFSLLYDEKNQRLLSSGSDRKLLSWNDSLQHQKKIKLAQRNPTAIDSNAIGNITAVADKQGILKIYRTGESLVLAKTQTAARGGIQSVVFHPVTNEIAIAGQDKSGRGILERWQYEESNLIQSNPTINPVVNPTKLLDIAFSLNEKWLGFIAADGNVGLVDLSSREKNILFKAHDDVNQNLSSLVFGKNSNWLITSNKSEIKTWDIQSIISARGTGNTPQVAFETVEKAGIQKLAINAKNNRLVVAGVKGFIGLYGVNKNTGKINTRNRKDLLGTSHHLSNVAFCSDGYTLATTALDGAARIWNVETGEELVSLPVTGGQSKYLPDLLYRSVDDEVGGCTITISTQENALLRYDFSHLSDNTDD